VSVSAREDGVLETVFNIRDARSRGSRRTSVEMVRRAFSRVRGAR
jgi:hypothetical protein